MRWRRTASGIYIGTHRAWERRDGERNLQLSRNLTTTRSIWSHYHNPRTVANNPAGETSLNARHHRTRRTRSARPARRATWGSSMRRRCYDWAKSISRSAAASASRIHTFGIFAGFKSQNALATHEDPKKASRPFDKARNGIVISEGGCHLHAGASRRCAGPRRENLRRDRRLLT